jgi:hypothetical protein
VRHPRLKRELAAILAACPPPAAPPTGRRRADRDACAATWGRDDRRPPLRRRLIWDNLAGHLSVGLDRWLIDHGILALDTPLAGSWLNLAAPRRVGPADPRAAGAGRDGHHPETAQQLTAWLAETVRGWDADPTPSEWGGKRAARRQRAQARRHALGGSAAYSRRPIRRRRHAAAGSTKTSAHAT